MMNLYQRLTGPVAVRALLYAGLALIALAAAFGARTAIRLHSQQHAEGRISELEPRQQPDGTIATYAHAEFRLPGGAVRQFVSPAPVSTDDFKTGETVPIAFPPGHPEQAQIATRGRMYRAAIYAAIAGGILFDLGCVLWILERRRELPQASRTSEHQRNRRVFAYLFGKGGPRRY